MRALILALAIAGGAGAAAAGPALSDGQGENVPVALPTPWVPNSARQQAMDVIRRGLPEADGARFTAVRAMEAASVRHGDFAETIDGPVSVVCGRYSLRDRIGGYDAASWFFVAIKQGQVLWASADKASTGAGEAYASCQNAGLTEVNTKTGLFTR
ncbi:MAG TPA: hypothetical protein VKQ70_18100 [Caulobacteraceae bacterium]|jgi:hypothetical protein|nr:hypothetical protein [Caulobacteraceae bacterium]